MIHSLVCRPLCTYLLCKLSTPNNIARAKTSFSEELDNETSIALASRDVWRPDRGSHFKPGSNRKFLRTQEGDRKAHF